MTRYDVKRELKQFYAPTNTDWALVDVPAQQFIAVDGRGDPNTSVDYARAVQALYAVAYGWTRFDLPKQHGSAEVVGGPIFTTWVLPFEVVSVLLLSALVGAVVVSRGSK